MSQCAGKSNALLLAAGESDASIADSGFKSLWHAGKILGETDHLNVGGRIRFLSHEDVGENAAAKKLGIMSQVAEDAALHVIGELPELVGCETDASLIRLFTEKTTAECGFSACYRTGNTNDFTGMSGKGKTGEYGFIRIGEGKIPDLKKAGF